MTSISVIDWARALVTARVTRCGRDLVGMTTLTEGRLAPGKPAMNTCPTCVNATTPLWTDRVGGHARSRSRPAHEHEGRFRRTNGERWPDRPAGRRDEASIA